MLYQHPLLSVNITYVQLALGGTEEEGTSCCMFLIVAVVSFHLLTAPFNKV
jgi:hypothetical protein